MSEIIERFGKYELLARLAVGGMAEIYKARYSPAPGVTKAICIKRILPHYAANKSFIAMFTNEARIAIGLSHGNIAQVFDFGEIDGDYFIAMELIDGMPLSKTMKRMKQLGIYRMPTAFAALIAAELLKGLHYAHTRLDPQGKPLKIVHRDVSPQNILVGFEGQVKMVDFGIAKARHAGQEATEPGSVKGKYAYFAPEQARGKELDARTDVFAAGIVLYEMICGQLPFPGTMMDALSKTVKAEFTPPRQSNPDVPEALEKIVLKAMSLSKSDRYQTAEEFQHALSAFLVKFAPTQSLTNLSQFMSFLYEAEQVAEGRPVKIPREMTEQIAQWKKAPLVPVAASQGPVETVWTRRPKKSGGPFDRLRAGNDDRSEVTAPNTSSLGKVALFVGVPLLGALLSGLAVYFFGR